MTKQYYNNLKLWHCYRVIVMFNIFNNILFIFIVLVVVNKLKIGMFAACRLHIFVGGSPPATSFNISSTWSLTWP